MYGSLSSRRILTVVLLVFSSFIILLTFTYSPSLRRYATYQHFRFGLSKHSCPPEAYASGHWTQKYNPPVLSSEDDILAVSGFEGCASSREVTWHLGTGWKDEEKPMKIQWRGNVSSYEWIPGTDCKGYTKVEREGLVRQLVEDGGWLVLGDSISEGHFFSLSCMLYPHVRATPDYTIDPWFFDRAWPQNLYLDPSSPLLPELDFPEGFEVDTTPLVTFRRVDLLLGKAELETLYKTLYPSSSSNPLPPLFSEEQTWDLAPSEYLPMFLAPLPEANYRTLIMSTAGHWTTTVFSGFHNDDEAQGNGLKGLLEFFGEAMKLWAGKVSTALEEHKRMEKRNGGRRGKDRQVVIRAYIHGHESCHEETTEMAGPLQTYKPLVWNWYNWNWIRRFNDVFQTVIMQRGYPNIHFLSIDMPALLRPDAHTGSDCLHTLTGAGIMEGWSQYISYFVSHLP